MGGKPLLEGPLSLVFTAVFAWPASWSAKKCTANPFKTSRGDLDNIQKCLADAMNGVVYADDAAIVRVCGEKSYGEVARLQIFIWEIAPCA